MSEGNPIKPNKKALSEALALAEEAIKNLELSEISLTNIALKASRVARLTNDAQYQQIMQYEAGGYPYNPSGVPPEIWTQAQISGRTFPLQILKDTKYYAYLESIEELEQQIITAKDALSAASDPNVSISSANPHQVVWSPAGNSVERNNIRQQVATAVKRVAQRRAFVHEYLQRKYYELKFSDIADDIFNRIREKTDFLIGEKLPASVQKFTSIYENLQSENPENWSGAVHSCRRLLQDLADAVFPATNTKRSKTVSGKSVEIDLRKNSYINRLVAFIEDNNSSERFEELVGSNLKYIGERLDSIFRASQKGSHGSVSKEEADRYVVYTYMVVSDILTLSESLAKKQIVK